MKQNGISRLERLVRETVEGSFGRLFGGRLEPMDVATQLVHTMEDSSSDAGTTNSFTVALHPSDYRILLAQNPNLADDLSVAAWKLGRRYGLPLSARPIITIVENETCRRHAFQISAIEESVSLGLDTTQVVDRESFADKALSDLKALDAFLVVQGKRHVALDRPLVTIGRRPDNDIVLDSGSVSRQHAQVRWRFDRFILYDVSNRRRTKINGETISERILRPGDVIALSDALLVYGEGNDRHRQDDDDQIGEMNTLVIPPKRT